MFRPGRIRVYSPDGGWQPTWLPEWVPRMSATERAYQRKLGALRLGSTRHQEREQELAANRSSLTVAQAMRPRWGKSEHKGGLMAPHETPAGEKRHWERGS
jgi:hypothetical protein